MTSTTPEIVPLYRIPDAAVERYGETSPCLLVRDRVTRTWSEISHGDFARLTHRIAAGLLRFGIGIGEGVAILSENKAEFLAIDLAVQQIRAFSIPIYVGSAAAEIRHILTEAEIRLVFVGDERQYAAVHAAVEGQHDCAIVCIKPEGRQPFEGETLDHFTEMEEADYRSYREEAEQRTTGYSPHDTAFILYTSGTSGLSKGVRLTQRNVVTIMRDHLIIKGLRPGRVSLMFLPLAHIFEKMFSLLCLECGIVVAVNENAHTLFHSMREIHPHFMCSVPRLWEKLYQGLQTFVSKSSPIVRSIARRSLKIAMQYQEKYVSQGKKIPLWPRLRYKLYNNLIFHSVKKRLGIDRGLVFPTSGAALSEEVQRSLIAMGVPIMYGYGLTETSASVSFCRQGDFVMGSVGKVIDSLELRIDEAEGGEILVRGDTVTPGYYKRPEENALAFTEDGFFRTGDLGRIDEEGNLFYIERKKDLYKTSNGKYIAPNYLESRILRDELFAQVVTIGDRRNYVAALIVPDYEKLSEVMGKDAPTDPEVLSKDPEAQAIVRKHLSVVQSDLADYERVKRFLLLPEPFTMENGLLTATMKVRRAEVIKRYTPEIDAMYGYSIDDAVDRLG